MKQNYNFSFKRKIFNSIEKNSGVGKNNVGMWLPFGGCYLLGKSLEVTCSI
jgi:hypothetical protein